MMVFYFHCATLFFIVEYLCLQRKFHLRLHEYPVNLPVANVMVIYEYSINIQLTWLKLRIELYLYRHKRRFHVMVQHARMINRSQVFSLKRELVHWECRRGYSLDIFKEQWFEEGDIKIVRSVSSDYSINTFSNTFDVRSYFTFRCLVKSGVSKCLISTVDSKPIKRHNTHGIMRLLLVNGSSGNYAWLQHKVQQSIRD